VVLLFIEYFSKRFMEIASSEWHISERWADWIYDYSDKPIGVDPFSNTPIFEGDSTHLCCLIEDRDAIVTPF
jgi:hypothetical protein